MQNGKRVGNGFVGRGCEKKKVKEKIKGHPGGARTLDMIHWSLRGTTRKNSLFRNRSLGCGFLAADKKIPRKTK